MAWPGEPLVTAETPAGLPRSPTAAAGIFGLVHALVDAACAAVLYKEQVPYGQLAFDEVCRVVLLYNALAFGAQFPLGFVADRLRWHWPMGVAGVAAVLAAVGMGSWSTPAAAVLAGLGNAMFHVGAGAIVFQQSPGRATEPGIFVAPGALGLVLGMRLGLAGFPGRWLVALALGVSLASFAFWRRPPPGQIAPPLPQRTCPGRVLCVALLVVVVAVRSTLGNLFSGFSRSEAMLLGLAAAGAAGKAIGGIAADRFGWRTTATAALLVLAPLVYAAPTSITVGLLGMLLVQISTPVTLAAVFTLFPRHPGTAFALPSVALLAGMVPAFAGVFSWYDPIPLLLPLVLACAALVYAGLSLLSRINALAGAGKSRAHSSARHRAEP